MNAFFRYPHTPHLVWLGNEPARDDKILSDREIEELLSGQVIVEEKVDGANIGISLDEDRDILIQNRGRYLERPYTGQFSRLSSWLGVHRDGILNAAADNLILFGEWCAAVHSVEYDMLSDWFLLFDVYSPQEKRFWSVNRRNSLAMQAGLAVVPELFRGSATISQLLSLLEMESRLGHVPLEGIVVRRDAGSWCEKRGKVVRSDFTQAIQVHWRKERLRWNRVAERCE
jgi:ATP-dependent RNA circularization protein (DNA/RNA ligase family)